MSENSVDQKVTKDLFQSTDSNEDADAFFSIKKNTESLDVGDLLIQFQSKGVYKLEHLSSIPFFKDLFIQFNTMLPSSAAVERLFPMQVVYSVIIDFDS